MISFRFGACSTLTTTLTVDSLKYEGKSLYKIQSFAFIKHGTSFPTFHCLRLRGHVANQNVFADILCFAQSPVCHPLSKRRLFLRLLHPRVSFFPARKQFPALALNFCSHYRTNTADGSSNRSPTRWQRGGICPGNKGS